MKNGIETKKKTKKTRTKREKNKTLTKGFKTRSLILRGSTAGLSVSLCHSGGSK